MTPAPTESVEIRWKGWVGPGAVAFAGLLGGCALWSWERSDPSALWVQALSVLGAAAALVFAAHAWRFRLRHGAAGLTASGLLGERTTPWDQIRQVRLIAQGRSGDAIWKAATLDPGDAFHVVLETSGGPINLNRWMTGIEPLLLELHHRGHFQEDRLIAQAQVTTAKLHSPVHRAVDQVQRGVDGLFAAVVLLFLAAVGGTALVVALRLTPTGHIGVDIGLASLAVLAVLGGVLLWLRALRRRRVGLLASEVGFTDTCLALVAGCTGPLLVLAAVQRLLGTERDGMSVGFLAVGLFFIFSAARTARAYLRGD